jgi:hypothetical protein
MEGAMLETTRRTIGGPIPAAVEAYRQAVFAAVEGTGPRQIDLPRLYEAHKLQADASRDIKRYERRTSDHRLLTERIPELETELAELKSMAQSARPLRERTFGEFATMDAILQAIRDDMNGTSPEKKAVKEKQREIETLKGDCTARLYQTAAPIFHRQLQEIQGRINTLRSAIDSRAELVNIDQRIAACRERCERMASGEKLHGFSEGIPITQSTSEAMYRAERAKLERLLAMAPGKDQAVADNARDEAEIAKLTPMFKPIREAMLEPRAMRWEE